jgi:hypothetical protein
MCFHITRSAIKYPNTLYRTTSSQPGRLPASASSWSPTASSSPREIRNPSLSLPGRSRVHMPLTPLPFRRPCLRPHRWPRLPFTVTPSPRRASLPLRLTTRDPSRHRLLAPPPRTRSTPLLRLLLLPPPLLPTRSSPPLVPPLPLPPPSPRMLRRLTPRPRAPQPSRHHPHPPRHRPRSLPHPKLRPRPRAPWLSPPAALPAL